MNKTLQAKHLDEKAILTFLKELPEYHDDPVLNGRQRTANTYQGPEEEWSIVSIFKCLPPNTPRKVMLAKMRAVIDKGLADGCACGCRGDFEITPKGLSVLETL